MEGSEDALLFMWPTTVVHPIDEESPFFHMSAKDFYRKHYEVIVCLEGIIEPTGSSIQARTSYLGDEILWGYRFVNVLHFKEGCYQIDYSSFDKVEKVETPTTSAKHQLDAKKPPQQPHIARLVENPIAQLQKVTIAAPKVFLQHENKPSSRPSSMIVTSSESVRRMP